MNDTQLAVLAWIVEQARAEPTGQVGIRYKEAPSQLAARGLELKQGTIWQIVQGLNRDGYLKILRMSGNLVSPEIVRPSELGYSAVATSAAVASSEEPVPGTVSSQPMSPADPPQRGSSTQPQTASQVAPAGVVPSLPDATRLNPEPEHLGAAGPTSSWRVIEAEIAADRNEWPEARGVPTPARGGADAAPKTASEEVPAPATLRLPDAASQDLGRMREADPFARTIEDIEADLRGTTLEPSEGRRVVPEAGPVARPEALTEESMRRLGRWALTALAARAAERVAPLAVLPRDHPANLTSGRAQALVGDALAQLKQACSVGQPLPRSVADDMDRIIRYVEHDAFPNGGPTREIARAAFGAVRNAAWAAVAGEGRNFALYAVRPNSPDAARACEGGSEAALRAAAMDLDWLQKANLDERGVPRGVFDRPLWADHLAGWEEAVRQHRAAVEGRVIEASATLRGSSTISGHLTAAPSSGSAGEPGEPDRPGSGSPSRPPQGPPPGPALPFGLDPHAFRRERCLRVEDYAHTVARVLAASPGDVSMALFGPWGRGKTYMAEVIQEKLPPNYSTVKFSAWKYRSTPETWAFLYETFLRTSRQDGVLATIARTTRAQLARHGFARLFFALFFLALSLLPLTVFLRPIPLQVLGALGVCGVWWLIRSARVLHGSAGKLSKLALPARHEEKLGAQAAIGEDLRALVEGWVPTPDPAQGAKGDQSRLRQKLLGLGLGVTLVAWAVNVGLAGEPMFAPLGFEMRAHPDPLIVLAVIAIVLAVGLAPVALALLRITSKRRILLVVDDLDRCPPGQGLEVIESLRLFLEDKTIGSRLQILMLTELSTLRHEVEEKYGKVSTTAFRDTVEKLFVGHLRLRPLAAEEVDEVFRRFTNMPVARVEALEAERARLAQKPTRAVKREAGDRMDIAVMEGRVDLVHDHERLARVDKEIERAREQLPPSPPAVSDTEVLGPSLTNDESRALGTALRLSADQVATVRAIKSAIFRFLLAKALLERRGVLDRVDVDVLARSIVTQGVHEWEGSADSEQLEHVKAVIEDLSLGEG